MNSMSDALAALVASRDPDRFALSFLLTSAQRERFFAISAATIELADIRAKASDPMAATIRLAWWRDRLNDEKPCDHPVIKAVWPWRKELFGVVEARWDEIQFGGRIPATDVFLDLCEKLHTVWTGDPSVARQYGAVQALCGLPYMRQTGLYFAPMPWLDMEPDEKDLPDPRPADRFAAAVARLNRLKRTAFTQGHPESYRAFLLCKLLLRLG